MTKLIREWDELPEPPKPKRAARVSESPDALTASILTRCTPAQKERWQAAARRRKVDLSALIRDYLDSLS